MVDSAIELLMTVAAIHPLVLVIDDYDTASQSCRELVEHLVMRVCASPGHPLIVLLVTNESQTFPADDNVRRIEAELDTPRLVAAWSVEKDRAALLDLCRNADTPFEARMIFDHLYAESLIDIDRDRGRWTITDAAKDVDPPDIGGLLDGSIDATVPSDLHGVLERGGAPRTGLPC